jgi:hypothetical protein
VWWSEDHSAYTSDDVDALASWAEQTDSVVAVRERDVDRPDSTTRALAALQPWGLSDRSGIPAIVVARVASTVVTSGAAEALDVHLLGRQVILHGATSAGAVWTDPALDGLPRPGDVTELVAALEGTVSGAPAVQGPPGRVVPLDGGASRRLVERIRAGSVTQSERR